MGSPAPATTCHSQYCWYFADNKTLYCSDIPRYVTEKGNTTIAWSDFPNSVACCRLYCGERSQTLQLQCQGTTQTMAILIWFLVAVLTVCALIQLVFICLERGARKVTMVGGPLFLAFISVIVYLVTNKDLSWVYIDTPYYPIVGAMSVSAFSYYFSSFQYSISLAQELAAAIALVFTMFPIWALLTVRVDLLVDYDPSRFDARGIRMMAGGVLTMLLLSILWILHSSVYRTVGYRAAWITVFNKQKTKGRTRPLGKSFMSRLWILAGAQGHSTWRTPTGQSFGLYLAALSWAISISIRKQLTCKDDLILFHILLWVSPSILTMAVLVSQLSISIRASCNLQDSCNLVSLWFVTEFQSQRETYAQYYDAVISYRLGRDTLEVEERGDIEKYRKQWLDRGLATMASYGETLTFVLAYPGIIVLGITQWLIGKCILKCTCAQSEEADQVNHQQSASWRGSSLCGVFDLFPMHRRMPLSEHEKIEAYRTLCENCVDKEAGMHYECSVVDSEKKISIHKCSRLKDERFQVDDGVREIFRYHRQEINLPLLLDNTSPSRLSYLLQELAVTMNQDPGTTPEREGDSEMSSLIPGEDGSLHEVAVTLNEDPGTTPEREGDSEMSSLVPSVDGSLHEVAVTLNEDPGTTPEREGDSETSSLIPSGDGTLIDCNVVL